MTQTPASGPRGPVTTPPTSSLSTRTAGWPAVCPRTATRDVATTAAPTMTASDRDTERLLAIGTSCDETREIGGCDRTVNPPRPVVNSTRRVGHNDRPTGAAMRARAMFGLFLMVLGAVHVGTAESPRPQAARRTAPAACRTGLATYRIVTKGPAASRPPSRAAARSTPTAVEGTCTNEYSDTRGGRFRTVSVTRHSTIADVVDEVSVNPPLQRALGTTTTVTGAGANSTNVSTTEYDAQKRLISVVAESRPSGQRSVTTYTTWDAAGRPTMATVAGRPADQPDLDELRRDAGERSRRRRTAPRARRPSTPTAIPRSAPARARLRPRPS